MHVKSRCAELQVRQHLTNVHACKESPVPCSCKSLRESLPCSKELPATADDNVWVLILMLPRAHAVLMLHAWPVLQAFSETGHAKPHW